MSTLRVTYLTNRQDDGAVEFSKGVTVASGYSIEGDTDINTTGVVTATTFEVDNVNVTGVITATNFVGSGVGITNLPGTSTGKAIAFGFIA